MMRLTAAAACATLICLPGVASGRPEPASAQPGRLIVLVDTGERRDDLPVAARHPSPDLYINELTRGFSGRLVRLYPMVQRLVYPQRLPQPAYLLLSNNRGGFPRFGLHLDGRRMPEAAYVDLHRNSTLSGRFGAMNQIYPHELLHIMVRDLVGAPPQEHDSQVHAVGVRTDRMTAFSEGFAEHAQVMAVEADATPEMRRLAADTELPARAYREVAAYRDALAARLSLAPKARMTFPFWFSRNEQVLRYHAVRENRFAREPPLPDLHGDAYRAYLLENTLPGAVDDSPKSASRLMATEGVVSTLFYRLATSEALQRNYRDQSFYARFGATRGQVDPLDNVYLKLFAAIKEAGYDTVAVMDAYVRLFPEDARAVDAILRSTLLDQELPRAPAVWLLNERLQTGTSLFDQYRGLPRAHTFDLNAASLLDLSAVPGVTAGTATEILANAPYDSVEDLRRVPAAEPAIAEFRNMEHAYRARTAVRADTATLSIQAVLYPYLRRALWAMVACAIASGALYRTIRRVRWYRIGLNGIAASIIGLTAGWTVDSGAGILAFVAPLALCGLPAAALALRRPGSVRQSAIILSAWALASLVPPLIVRPMG